MAIVIEAVCGGTHQNRETRIHLTAEEELEFAHVIAVMRESPGGTSFISDPHPQLRRGYFLLTNRNGELRSL